MHCGDSGAVTFGGIAGKLSALSPQLWSNPDREYRDRFGAVFFWGEPDWKNVVSLRNPHLSRHMALRNRASRQPLGGGVSPDVVGPADALL